MLKTKRKPELLTVAQTVLQAGGIAYVSIELQRSHKTVEDWYYGRRRPSAGPVREALCKLAKVKVDEVDWEAGR